MKRDRKSAKLVVLETDDPIFAETEAIQSRIRQRAFELSMTRPPDAQELFDWMTAESEIISVPPTELLEKNGTFELKCAVAGVDPDDISVMVRPNQIVIKSDYRHQHSIDDATVHLCDFKSATVFRTVNLPKPIDVNTVKAKFDQGVLRLKAVKEEASVKDAVRPKRKPTVKKSRVKTP